MQRIYLIFLRINKLFQTQIIIQVFGYVCGVLQFCGEPEQAESEPVDNWAEWDNYDGDYEQAESEPVDGEEWDEQKAQAAFLGQ